MWEVRLQGSEAGPLLQALMASLPKVPDMPKKAPAKLPVIHSVSASPQQQSQVHARHIPPLARCLEYLHRCCLDVVYQSLRLRSSMSHAVPGEDLAQCIPRGSTLVKVALACMHHRWIVEGCMKVVHPGMCRWIPLQLTL